MKKTIFILALFITCNLIGQNKWRFGSTISFDNNLSSEYLITDANINGYSIDYDQFNFTFGFIAEYKLNKKLFLETGIEYSNKDFTGIYNCATCFPNGLWIYSKEKIEQRFIQIPILFKYYLIDQKIKLSIKTGLKNNFSIENKLDNKKYYLEGIIGSEIEYRIINNWNLGLGFNYNKSLTNLYNDENFDFKTNSFYLKVIYGIK
ncbi:outer membrane beta-barrel protein [Tenacibaculum insulae]|uniref:outer membrane beta-barrel protein n=1 Tax=Tenacibaculum insulae TaxID=2029677 RepID=UPI003AB1B2D1